MKKIVSGLVIALCAGVYAAPTFASNTVGHASEIKKIKENKSKNKGAISTFNEDPMHTVEVTEQFIKDCEGIYSDECGWEGWDGTQEVVIYAYGKGRVSGGGSPDGTWGTAMVNWRQPGCIREESFVNNTLTQIFTTGQPVGQPLPLELGDPKYNNGEWVKYETKFLEKNWNKTFNTTTIWEVRMHYMFNIHSGYVDQVKLKNSYEYGCIGISHPGQ